MRDGSTPVFKKTQRKGGTERGWKWESVWIAYYIYLFNSTMKLTPFQKYMAFYQDDSRFTHVGIVSGSRLEIMYLNFKKVI